VHLADSHYVWPFVRGFATVAQKATLRSCAQMQALNLREPMQDTGSGFVSTLESLAQSFVVASVLWMMFLVVAWPFVTVSRLVFYIGSFGSVKPTYRQALEHQGIVGLAFLIFVPLLFYVHIVHGARLYGNQSD